jgi:hypothetical protein
MRRYLLLAAILVLGATACKKELTKTALPENTNISSCRHRSSPSLLRDHRDPGGQTMEAFEHIWFITTVYFSAECE